MSEIQDIQTRIRSHTSVQCLVVVNNEGKLVQSFYGQDRKEECDQIIKTVPQLCFKARSTVRDLDPTNDLIFFRIKLKSKEILVAPDKDFMLIVVQNCGKNDRRDDE
ncbi:hypothetical protein PPERSA_05865 [Pseudocohnilembus persalinus]|uniref:Dynein light chain roadblock n=1 Tax=Pseudocohnilembus persalinus TaxID=266149 RepID=A0A0V0R3X9_PSEPJ|nr:hypothetical protein PPERSA_05865 [Pseudocohnilembus persalinus]|eukprot:KRX09196.1 hypothetical protein PPERSA_05865 [Pseudocohnilembus persalinus]